jgi:DivIVA domain-containing protein
VPFQPHEIESKRFVVGLRGYQTGEVEAFLRAVAADYAVALEAAQRPSETEEQAAELIRAAERHAETLRQAAVVELEAAEAEIDRRAAELAQLEADVRSRLTDLERLLADGIRALGGRPFTFQP